MKQSLVTGANRGIGLELSKQLKQKGYQVWAVCRKASPELKQAGVNVIEGVDVTHEADLQKLVGLLKDQSLDLLINNAGILKQGDLENSKAEDLMEQFKVNALAPLLVTRALLGKLKNPSKVAMITSRMGSIADNTSGSYYGYRASKAALNAFSKSLSIDLKPKGIAVAMLHPGYVQTDMTGRQGDRTPADSAKDLLLRIDDLNLENTGTFWHCEGEVLPW